MGALDQGVEVYMLNNKERFCPTDANLVMRLKVTSVQHKMSDEWIELVAGLRKGAQRGMARFLEREGIVRNPMLPCNQSHGLRSHAVAIVARM